jgi:hypothetical protein
MFAKVDDTRFNLYVFGQPAPAADSLPLGDLLRVHVIAGDPVNDAELDRAGIPRPSFYLVRPDGYIGLCGTDLAADDLKRYMTLRLVTREQPPARRMSESRSSTPPPP